MKFNEHILSWSPVQVVPINLNVARNGIINKNKKYRVIVSSDRYVCFSNDATTVATSSNGALLKAGVENFLNNYEDGSGTSYKYICFSVAIVVANDSVVEIV